MTHKRKFLTALLVSCVFLSGCIEDSASVDDNEKTGTQILLEDDISAMKIGFPSETAQATPAPYPFNSVAGNYLATQFAQNRHDWKTASSHLEYVLKQSPDEPNLLKMSMLLSAGSGNVEGAIRDAKALQAGKDGGALSPLFEAVGLFKAGDMQAVSDYIKTMPRSGLSEFIYPVLQSWSDAAMGIYDVDGLKSNTIHLKHAVLISDFMQKNEEIETLLSYSVNAHNISVAEIETIADGYIHIGKSDKAALLFEEILKQIPQNTDIREKLDSIQAGNPIDDFEPVSSPKNGVALALSDMAHLLYQESSDDSARIFAHLALYLNDGNQDPVLLLGSIAQDHDLHDKAIGYFESIKPEHPKFLESQREAANIMNDGDDLEGAIKKLNYLVDHYNDLESLIRIGDLYREKKEFKQSVKFYNRAEKTILQSLNVETLPPKFWHLMYVRGMSNEQEGNWDDAERDLKMALKLRPDHPYVLNYLGYAWSDQGKNLEESLAMIEKAVKLLPNDGYITDSLGWVYFRMGRFDEAVPYLERAVELVPYDPVINDHLGDAYWRVGRQLEAKFQWERARNHAEKPDMIERIVSKISEGLPAFEAIQQADVTQDKPDTAADTHVQ